MLPKLEDVDWFLQPSAKSYLSHFVQVDNQQAVIEIVIKSSAFDGSRKLQGFFKAAVGYFHLLIGHSYSTGFIAAASGNVKCISLNVDFNVLR